MPGMHVYSFTEEDLTKLANQVKEVLVATLHVEGELPGEPKKISSSYAVLAVKGNMLGRLWNKVRGVEDEELRWTVVKSTDLKE